MSEENPPKNIWDKFVLKLEKLREHWGTVVHISKTKWDVTLLQKRKSDLLKELGSHTLTMLSKGNFQEEELGQIVNLIKGLEEKISQKQSALSNFRR